MGDTFQHPERVVDVIDIFGSAQVSIDFTNVGDETGPLPEGYYDIWSNENCFIKDVESTGDATNVTADSGYIIFAGNPVNIRIRDQHKIGVIRDSVNGKLRLHKVG